MRLRARAWARPPAIDTPDARTLRLPAFRTRLFQLVLVVAAVVLLGLAAASAHGSDTGRQKGLLPGSTGVLVIDLSLSVGANDYKDIRRTIRRLVEDDASLGLVIFSDVGYELLPPGTSASQLRPLLRFFTGKRRAANPWARSFSAGTQISSALELASQMLARDGVEKGSILLVSDLITAPEDVPQLARTVRRLKSDSITIRIVPLSPLPDGRTIFEGLLGEGAFIAPSHIGDRDRVEIESQGSLSRSFLVLGGLVLLVLGLHERLVGRLGLPEPQRRLPA
jgi:hypothetical protein